MKRLFTLGVLAWMSLSGARADEADEALAKQKAAAETAWKKMDFKDAAPPVETANLIIYSRTNAEKTKALGASLDKIMAVALKALKYDGMEKPWPGKLAVFVLPDRGEFVDFMRKFAKKSPGEADVSYGNVSGDFALLVVGAPRIGTHEPDELARVELAGLLLRRKLGGADPPGWLIDGFARASAYRVVNKTGKAAPTPRITFPDLWNDGVSPQVKANAATFYVDYLAYGPGAELFPAFVGALRPNENGGMARVKDVLEAIKMDELSFETYARGWKKLPTPKTPPKKPEKPKGEK